MTVYPVQASFTRGEITPKLHDRQDFDQYRLGLAECTNWIIQRHSGITRRPGTQFITEVKDSSKKVRLIGFAYSSINNQNYILEFGDYYIRIIKDGGLVESGGAPVEVVTPWSQTDVHELDFAASNDVMYIAHPSYAPRRLSRTSHSSWTLSTVLPIDGPYLAKNITSNHAELGGDIIAGQGTSVTFDNAKNINGGAGFSSADLGRAFRWEKRYATDSNSDDVSLNNDFLIGWGYISAVNSSISIDVAWEGGAGEENAPGQVIVDVQDESNNPDTDDDGDDVQDEPNNPDTDDGGDSDRSNWWWLGAWYGNDNWPAKVRFSEHGERIVWARSNSYPLTSWFSRTNDFENYCPSDKDGAVTDDMGMSRTLSTDGAQPIRWLADARNAVVIGTSEKLTSITSATESEPFSPNNSKADPISNNGSEEHNPVFVDTALLYIGTYGYSLREMVYSVDVNGYITPDSSILSEHLLKSKINGPICYARIPNSNVWTHTTNGEVPLLTYERDQRTVGWTRQRIAGGSADNWGVVEGVESIPGIDRDEVYLVVKRTINGSTKRYIESVAPLYDQQKGDDQELAVYLDSAVIYNGSATTTLSTGFDHLRGETCGIIADGRYLGTVDIPHSGAMTIPEGVSASKIVLGLVYTSRLKLLPPPVQGPNGTLIGRSKLSHEAIISLYESAQCNGIKVGNTLDGEEVLQQLFPEKVDFETPTKPDIVTGRYKMEIEDDWENENGPTLVVDQPYPVTVRSIGVQLEMEP